MALPTAAVTPDPRDDLFAPKRTLFPSMDGSTPGDQNLAPPVPNPQNPVATEIDEPLGSLSVIPQLEGAGPPADLPLSVEIEVPSAPAPKKRTAQERIDQLTRRYRETQEQNTGLQDQIRTLTDMVQRLSQPQPRAVAPSAAPANDLGAYLGGTQEAAVPAGASASPAPVADVAGIVNQAISTYDQRRQIEQARQAQLIAAHEEAFAAAVEEMPELADGRTAARKHFNQLFAVSPLRTLPDGPYQVALQVRGILASEATRAAGSQTVEARKAQANINIPAPTNQGLPREINRAALAKELESINTALRSGDKSFKTYKRWKDVRAALQNTR